MILFTVSIALNSILSLPIWIIILILGLVATIYTSFGGIRADIFSDTLQTIILFLGAILTILIISIKMGGISPILDTISKEGHLRIPIVSMNITSISGILIWAFFINISVFGTDQVMVQRCLCSKTLDQAGKGVLFSFIGSLFFGILLSLIGFCLFAYFANKRIIIQNYFLGGLKENSDKIFPFFIANCIHVGLAGLIIAALLAAAMSSLDSGINSSITVMHIDIREKFGLLWPKCPSLIFVKRMSFYLGLLITILALLLPSIRKGNILTISAKFAGWFEGSMAAIFILGVITKRATPFGTIFGALTGVLTGSFFSYSDVKCSAE